MPKVPLAAPRASVKPLSPNYARETGVPERGLQAVGGALSQASEFVSKEYAKKRSEEETAINLGADVEYESALNDLFMGTADAEGFADLDWHGARDGIKGYEDGLRTKKAEVLSRVPEHLREKVKADLDRTELAYRVKGQAQYGKLQQSNKNASRQAMANNAMVIFATSPTDPMEIERAKVKITKATEGMGPEMAEAARSAYLGKGYSLAVKALLKAGTPESAARAKEYLDDPTISGYLVAGGHTDKLDPAVDAAVMGHQANAIAQTVAAKKGLYDDQGRPLEEEWTADIDGMDISAELKDRVKEQAKSLAAVENERVNTSISEISDSIIRDMTAHHDATGKYESTPSTDASIAVLSLVDPGMALKFQERFAREEAKNLISSRREKTGADRAKLRKIEDDERGTVWDIRNEITDNTDEWLLMSRAQQKARIAHLPEQHRNWIEGDLLKAKRGNLKGINSMTHTTRLVRQGLFELQITKSPDPKGSKRAVADRAAAYVDKQLPAFYEKNKREPDLADIKQMIERGRQEGEVIGAGGLGLGKDMTRQEAARRYPNKTFLSDEEVTDFESSTDELNAELKRTGKPRTKDNRLELYLDTLNRERNQ